MTTKNQFVDIAALFKRQDKKARKWLAEWMPRMSSELESDEQRLRAYLAGKDDVVHLSSYLGYLQNDYLVPFEHAALHEGVMRWDLLAISARYSMAEMLVHATRTKHVDPDRISSALESSLAKFLSELLIANWQEAVGVLFQAIYEGLDSVFIDWQGIRSWYPQFQFLVFLMAEFNGLALDRMVYRFPHPELPIPYETVLADWRSTDLDQVQGMVSEMADFHVANSAKDMYPFGCHSEILFPYEILAFLRIREWAGLENPKRFDHPLMNTPLAVLPSAPLPWPDAPLLDQAIAKFKTEYPEHNYFDRLSVPG
jgi:hypothetical protein